MKAINLIFPHQLFVNSPLLKNGKEVYLIEEYLFFKQFLFHKQKIAFHRASMKYYQHFLEEKGIKVHYIQSNHRLSDIRRFKEEVKSKNITEINLIDPTDNWLEKRIETIAKNYVLNTFNSPLFINTKKELSPFFRTDKKFFFQTTFYKQQRKRLKILLEDGDQPKGGKWTYDADNRKKYPNKKTPPTINFPEASPFWTEAVVYTNKHFKNNPGQLSKKPIYPTDHEEAENWFNQFLTHRFRDFGSYEDAIVKQQSFLHHSILSPLLNVGLISPQHIVNQSLSYAEKKDIPLNSTEGFIRQLIGWREFIRGMYLCKGSNSRTRNFWGFNRRIPSCFYDATTGIEPVDETIKQVLKTGYCHHIERLMILGNFMLLCEFDPDKVYQWFMELFIDAYDWVMVPNVYGMSQFSDGGTFATKPYIGASNYINKMGNYPKGDWEEIWDGLFWRFIASHQDFFKSNPRTSMLYYTYNRMSDEKKQLHVKKAEEFIEKIMRSV
ncbi:cryptochrome/photolyase family protein [Arenibacter aquaticus]|uniref:Cryptochrome/photolyase family protein n=1 Tax=Arenibacter aquaticus TaxID=2489054 RepID=A0A3S0AN23_9FLAO|nr:cryptochrome/photolyase family protein [Arenibacter aquaticus]RTE53871.1 cryptochrome/photolyase family protein [Arenibacter aquaticus]